MNSEKTDSEFISELSKKLDRKQPSQDLWSTIENKLSDEKPVTVQPKKRTFFSISFWQESNAAPQFAFSLAVFGLIALAYILSFKLHTVQPVTGSVTAKSDSAIHNSEEYYQAISVMERFVKVKKSAIDPHIMAVNKEKLSSIDESIKSCENALIKNDMNEHIKQFLNKSLSQKYSTLKFLVGQIREKHNNEKS